MTKLNFPGPLMGLERSKTERWSNIPSYKQSKKPQVQQQQQQEAPPPSPQNLLKKEAKQVPASELTSLLRKSVDVSTPAKPKQTFHHVHLNDEPAGRTTYGHTPTKDTTNNNVTSSSTPTPRRRCCPGWCNTIQTTLIGAVIFVLYHVVFCLAFASSVTLPYHPEIKILGPMARMAALSVISGGAVNLYGLGGDFPALYPAVDLFLVPFLAHAASVVDESLFDQDINDGEVFLTTFHALVAVILSVCGALCVLGSVFKLANMGAFLPYPVLCGFFSAVAVVLWTLAFGIDNKGAKIGDVLGSRDWSVMQHALIHHLPSLALGIAMYILGPKHPFMIAGMVLATVGLVYAVMAIMNVSLEEARNNQWFYEAADLVYEGGMQTIIDKEGGAIWNHLDQWQEWWILPAPLGYIHSIIRGKLNFTALKAAVPTIFPTAFIYTLRCSLHSAALKKNLTILLQLPVAGQSNDDDDGDNLPSVAKKAKPSELKAFFWYGVTQFAGVALGGVAAVAPCVAGSSTLYQLGAMNIPPQIGSMLLVVVFYITNFKLCTYIPKMIFSALVVLLGLNLGATFFWYSYFKTKDKVEWAVVPLITVASFVVGSLDGVALGICLSLFLFVASFYRTGVVKFLSNGLTARSTIERVNDDACWLDENGDLIQILVLQNYLFFGNATSCLRYIESMFEEPDKVPDDLTLPPIPEYIIIDFALVTGMDTSAVDVFAEIITQAHTNSCTVFLSGLSYNLRSVISTAGVSPGRKKDFNRLRFFPGLDEALGAAEDRLLKEVAEVEKKALRKSEARTLRRIVNKIDDGFLFALAQIDEQHDTDFADELSKLKDYVIPLTLHPGERLFDSDASNPGTGLFFIEHGLMRVDRDTSSTMTRSGNRSLKSRNVSPGSLVGATAAISGNYNSIGQLKARSNTIARQINLMKSSRESVSYCNRSTHSFRLARIGAGWVVGTLESCSRLSNPGIHIAMTTCRLHHLRSDVIEELEVKEPALILTLFKLMSYVTARRQDITIEQLATLQSIMSSRGQSRPVGRLTLAAVNNALQSYS